MAQVDTGIYAQFLRQPKSIDDYTADADAKEANRLQLLLQRGAVSDRMAAADRQRNILRAMQGLPPGATVADRVNALQSVGGFSEADAILKGDLERTKITSENAKRDQETKGLTLDQSIKAHEFQVQKLGAINTPEGALEWAKDAQASGIFTPDQYTRGVQALQRAASSPQAFAQWKDLALRGGMSATEQLKAQQEAEKIAETARNNREQTRVSEEGNKRTVAATIRGQNMVDARTREATEASKAATQSTYDSERGIVVDRGTGASRAVMGADGKPLGAKDKPLNDTQAKALLFGSRMREADNILGGLAGKGVDQPGLIKRAAEGVAGAVPIVGESLADAAGFATNWTQSAGQQQVEQAQRDFVNAVLRRESGAAISPTEFASAEKQYFPKSGDSKEVREQKARNRALAIQGLLAEVPTDKRDSLSATEKPKASAPAKPGAPSSENAYGGLKFLGFEGGK